MQMTVGRAVSILVATSLMSDLWDCRKVQATDPADIWLMNSPAALNGLTSKDPAEQFVVQIRNLNYYYGQGRIVHAGVAQHQSGFAEGPDCMTGPSGSGKTTLLA